MAHQQPAHMHILSYALESWEGAFGNDSVVVYGLNYEKTTIYVNIVGLSGYEVEKRSMRNKGTTDFTHVLTWPTLELFSYKQTNKIPQTF